VQEAQVIAATKLRKAKTYSDLIATWVTILGAFAGGLWALTEYREKVHDAEVEATLRYAQQYNTAPVWDIRGRLEAFWSERANDVFGATAKGDAELSEYVVKTLDADASVQADTGATIDFFSGLGTCLCAGLCDSQSAIRLFGKDADDFFELNLPYIRRQQEHLHDAKYAAGVSAIAVAYRKHEGKIAESECAL
jgi:hypothetical protein